jgi:enterochelin esterase family protein
MTTAIYEFARQIQIDPASIEAFFESHSFPIVEESCVTFVYRGDADAVLLQHWIQGLPPAQPFTRMSGSDIWFLIQELPEGSRVEYRFDVLKRGRHESITDPLNPKQTPSPSGDVSVLHARGYDPPDWINPDPESREGSLEDVPVPSEAFGEERRIQVYLPARFRETRRYPLLIVNDGEQFLRYASLKAVLDNLIHRLDVAPLVVALTDPVDRLTEYADNTEHARFIAEELLPAVEKRYPIDARPAARGLMGVSFGAVASLATAWRYPGVFDRLLIQSCSFHFEDTVEQTRRSAVDPVGQFVSPFRDSPRRPSARIFLSCGVYETRIFENRSLLPVLQATGADVRYVESKDGHNFGNWRNRLREGLSWLFPGPMWMVYE